MLAFGATLFAVLAILCVQPFRRRVSRADMTTWEYVNFLFDGFGLVFFVFLSVECLVAIWRGELYYPSIQYLSRIPQVAVLGYVMIQWSHQMERHTLYKLRCRHRAEMRELKESK